VKLRIKGNSIRLRLSKSEVEGVAGRGWVEDSVRFAPQTALAYRLEVGDTAELSAVLDGARIRVVIPRARVTSWLEPNQVSIHGEQVLPGGETLGILVEKDFECLNPRTEDDGSDLFAHPGKSPV
jgi:hypothetical protein